MDKKKLSNVLFVIALLLIVVSVGTAAAAAFSDFTVGNGIAFAAEAICGITAFLYFINGYKKDDAKYYRAVFLTVAASYIVESFSESLLEGNNSVWLAFILVVYGCNLILGVSKDLGKTPSLCLGAVNAVAYTIALMNDIATAGTTKTTLLFSVSWLASALVALVMITAKYIDKENRNTK